MLVIFLFDSKFVVFVFENDLYVKDLVFGKIICFMIDGKKNVVINGMMDWVYEEEFVIIQGFGWLFDFKYLVYMCFDESVVCEFDMIIYGQFYLEEYCFKYLKVGEDNFKVMMYIVEVNGNGYRDLLFGSYEYIFCFQWLLVKNELIVLIMNCYQSELKYYLIFLFDVLVDKVIYIENFFIYIEIDNNLFLLVDGKFLFCISEKDGYNYLYQLNFDGIQ